MLVYEKCLSRYQLNDLRKRLLKKQEKKASVERRRRCNSAAPRQAFGIGEYRAFLSHSIRMGLAREAVILPVESDERRLEVTPVR